MSRIVTHLPRQPRRHQYKNGGYSDFSDTLMTVLEPQSGHQTSRMVIESQPDRRQVLVSHDCLGVERPFGMAVA